jgi:hypothetical protein
MVFEDGSSVGILSVGLCVEAKKKMTRFDNGEAIPHLHGQLIIQVNGDLDKMD